MTRSPYPSLDDEEYAAVWDSVGLVDDLGPGTLLPEVVPIRLGPTVSRFVESRADVVILYSGRGEGKSTGGVARPLAVANDVAERPLKVAVVRDTWTNIHRALIPTLTEGAGRGWWDVQLLRDGTEARINDDAVHLYLFGMDRAADANKFQSFECGLVWLEEPAPAADLSSGIPVDVFAMAVSSLRQPGVPRPSVQITMNPPDQDHWTLEIEEYLREQGHAEMQVEMLRIPPGENPHLPAGYRTKMRLALEAAGRPDLVRRLVEGSIGTVLTGDPVTPEFSDLHIAPKALQIRLGWETWRSFDYGRNPTIVWGQQTPLGQLNILGCLVGVNMGMEELLEQHAIPWEQRFGLRAASKGQPFGKGGKTGVTWRATGDPAGAMREQSGGENGERSARRVVENLLRTRVEPVPVEWAARRDAMRAALTRMIGGRPLVQLDPEECVPLIQALRGRWKYAKYPSGKISEKPVKDMACVDEATDILTPRGFLPCHMLRPGMPVYGFDLVRRQPVLDRLIAVHRYHGEAELYLWSSVTLSMAVTATHRMIVAADQDGLTLKSAADVVSSPESWRVPSRDHNGAYTRLENLWTPCTMLARVVWCPQTTTGTWIGRRNGTVWPTGNSHPGDAFGYLCAKLYPVTKLTQTIDRTLRRPMRNRVESWMGA